MTTKDRVGDIIETEIKDLAFDGKSVGTNNGKIVFLNAGLPGETVRARLIKTKAKFSVGKVEKILKKSSDRIEPECPHFELCGGCTWQDLDYDNQLYYKRKQVVDCIEHIGKLTDIEVAEIVPCADHFYYRNKMEFSFNAADDGGFNLGLHHRGKWDQIFDVTNCLLESKNSNRIIEIVREFVRENKIPAYDVNNHLGFIRFLMIREAKNNNQTMINLVTTDGAIPNIDSLIDKLIATIPEIRTIVHNTNNSKSNIAKGESETILYGDGFIEEIILGKKFKIYANSFFQTNSRQAEKLYSTAFEFLEADQSDYLIDFYCGTGTIGLCASDRVKHVVGIELEDSSVKAAQENAGINSIKNIDFIAGSVQDVLKNQPEIFRDATCAVVDPPRAGLHPKAIKRLLEMDLKKLVYISCNPATFARDASQMAEAGYKIKKVVPVDMFPHTMHIELAAGLYK
ncbi:MAG: 23S rRNA (uracil(1939)-C(5))-methyltransferase RlmD [Candidatus Zixiibacteriota bacterium]